MIGRCDDSGSGHVAKRMLSRPLSCHAEMKVLKMWMAINFRTSKRRHLRSLKIFSLRGKLTSSGELLLSNGKPCKRCHETLQSWNIHDVYYSSDSNQIVSCRWGDVYEPTGGDRRLGRL